MRAYWLEIHGPDVAERHRLDLGTTRFGGEARGARRTRALEGWTGPVEIRVSPDGCDVTLPAGASMPIVVCGVEHRRANVPWGEDAFVDGLRFSFVSELERHRGMNPLLTVASVLAAFAFAFSLARASAEPSISKADPPAPELNRGSEKCPVLDAEAAGARAHAFEASGSAHRERFPFAMADGAAAASAVHRASLCYRLAGQEADAARAEAEASALWNRVDGEYAAARLTLRSELEAKDFSAALSAARELGVLLGPGPDAYRRWLAETRRNLELHGY